MSGEPDDAPGPAEPASPVESSPSQAGSGAREVLLRAALGVVLGLVPAVAFLLFEPRARREWYFVAIGLFLGGLGGLAGFVERLGAGRSARAQLGLALTLCVVATAWGLAAIFQAEWTQVVLTNGGDAATARVAALLQQLLRKLDRFLHIFLPLGALVATQTLVRTRRGGRLAHLAAAALPVALGALFCEKERDRQLILVFGTGLFVVNAASAWAAGAMARRWWPAPPPDPASPATPPGAGAT